MKNIETIAKNCKPQSVIVTGGMRFYINGHLTNGFVDVEKIIIFENDFAFSCFLSGETSVTLLYGDVYEEEEE